MVGAIGSYFDLGSVSEGILEPRSAGAKICSVGVPSVCEGEIVYVEVDSGAAVSCLPASIGADTFPLYETRLTWCHNSVFGSGRCARRCCELVGAIQSHEFFAEHKILAGVAGRRSSLRRCYFVRKATGNLVTLVTKRCAWHLRVKLKPHSELPHAGGEEFMEVMSLDRGAGVRLVQEGSSSSSGPAAPEDVEGECASEKAW